MQFYSTIINKVFDFFQQSLIGLVYFLIALYLSPLLTIFTAIFLGGLTYVIRNVVAPAYSIGDEIADANEKIQTLAQSGTVGIRDIKLFGVADDIYEQFVDELDRYVDHNVALGRNQSGISNLYQFASATTVFLLIYVSLEIVSLSLAEIGVFLFAMYWLVPALATSIRCSTTSRERFHT